MRHRAGTHGAPGRPVPEQIAGLLKLRHILRQMVEKVSGVPLSNRYSGDCLERGDRLHQFLVPRDELLAGGQLLLVDSTLQSSGDAGGDALDVTGKGAELHQGLAKARRARQMRLQTIAVGFKACEFERRVGERVVRDRPLDHLQPAKHRKILSGIRALRAGIGIQKPPDASSADPGFRPHRSLGFTPLALKIVDGDPRDCVGGITQ